MQWNRWMAGAMVALMIFALVPTAGATPRPEVRDGWGVALLDLLVERLPFLEVAVEPLRPERVAIGSTVDGPVFEPDDGEQLRPERVAIGSRVTAGHQLDPDEAEKLRPERVAIGLRAGGR